jgi:hypothetical protein
VPREPRVSLSWRPDEWFGRTFCKNLRHDGSAHHSEVRPLRAAPRSGHKRPRQASSRTDIEGKSLKGTYRVFKALWNRMSVSSFLNSTKQLPGSSRLAITQPQL